MFTNYSKSCATLSNQYLCQSPQEGPDPGRIRHEIADCAVNRRTRDGALLDGEAVDVWEALRAVTVNGAYQYFEEDRKGTIAPGKSADFTVLDRNPLAAEPMGLREIRVLATIKEDDCLWKAKGC